MTSGTFQSFAVDAIFIDRSIRQRRSLEGIEDLARSISERGLINPITITPDGSLIAGERRLAAVQSLGWTHIPAQIAEVEDKVQLELIELEENTRRVDLPWQENCLAVHRIHELLRASTPGWKTADTARHLNISETVLNDNRAVAAEIKKGTSLVLSAPAFSTARNIVKRKNERATAALVDQALPEPARGRRYHVPVLPQDFLSWLPPEPRCNFLHCDFPYGISSDKHDKGAATSFGGYADTADTYFTLLDYLLSNVDKILHSSAHIMFWFAMPFYQRTLDLLSKEFWIDERPLVWLKSDNTGILSDPNRRPRYIYETAFYGSRGDRPLVRPKANAIASPTTKLIHMSEKPLPVLAHFFEMFVDEHTFMLDPTAGSGTAVVQARLMNAAHAIGLEKDAAAAEIANAHWKPLLQKESLK